MEDNSNIFKWTKALYIIYLIALFWIIVFKFDVPFSNMGYLRSINLIPFKSSLIINGKIDYSEMIMNIVIFMPLGIYSGILFKKWNNSRKIFLFFLISFICEAFQFILGIGASDITDIINNTLGGVTGLLIYKGIIIIFKDSNKAHKFINFIATIGTTLMILLLGLLVVCNL
ncbi:MAG: VanZ family protein [Clostridiales bacterium]|nr:VanZ family protein [Clostridiales bacterium]